MATRILLVLAALGVLYGCGKASSPPEHREKQGSVEEAATASAPTTLQDLESEEPPALLGDEQMAKLDDAGRKQLLACQRDMAYDVWGKKQAAEEEIAYRIKQARKKGHNRAAGNVVRGIQMPREDPGHGGRGGRISPPTGRAHAADARPFLFLPLFTLLPVTILASLRNLPAPPAPAACRRTWRRAAAHALRPCLADGSPPPATLVDPEE